MPNGPEGTGRLDGEAGHAQSTGEAGIAARLERLPLTSFHMRILAIVGTGHFFDSFDALSIAFVLPVLIPLWNISHSQVALLISSGYLGQLLGGAVFGWLAERYGRLNVLSTALIIIAGFSLACAFAGGMGTLLVFRFFQGFGLGAEIPIGACYINEITPARFRGKVVFGLQTCFAVGSLVTAIAASWMVPELGWRSLFVVGAMPIILGVSLRFIVPESPRWLASRGRFVEAEESLRRIEAAAPGDSRRDVVDAENVPTPATPMSGTFGDLLSPALRQRTLSLWLIAFCLSFAGYGLLAWMPTLYTTIYAVPLKDALQYGAVQTAAGLAGAVAGFMLIDRLGRRKTFLLSFAGGAAPLLWLASINATDVKVVVLMSAASMFFMTMLLIGLNLYATEIYPTRVRAIGAGVTGSWFRLATIVGPVAVGALLSLSSIQVVFLAFGGACILGAATVFLYALETRGRVLEQVA